MGARSVTLSTLGACLIWGCTFYTSCPTDTGTNAEPDPDPAGGGEGNTGGSSAGNTGGSSAGDAGNNPDEGGSPGEDGEWINVTGNLGSRVIGPDDSCGNIYLLSVTPGEDRLIAGIGGHGLWATTDGGQTWSELGTGEGSEPIPNIPTAIVYDPDHPEVFWESGIYDSGIFKTEDGGETFHQVSDLRHNELVSVDFTDPERKVVLAGGHEQRGMLYLSRDGGMSFEEIGASLPEDAGVSSFPLVLDASTFLLGTQDFGGGVTGVFRSTDAGASWSQVGEGGGVWQPLVATDGTIYWSGDSNGDMIRSSDDGESFEAVASTGAQITLAPIELPDGRIASVSARYVVVSDDRAETWKPVSPPLPFRPRALAYSPEQKAFFISHETCPQVEEDPDAVMRYDFDYSASVVSP